MLGCFYPRLEQAEKQGSTEDAAKIQNISIGCCVGKKKKKKTGFCIYVVIFFRMFAAQKKMFMGRFKISKNKTYFVRLFAGAHSSEGNIRGASSLQALKNMAYSKYWIPKYRRNCFPEKMIVEDEESRQFRYTVTLSGNVRTSK